MTSGASHVAGVNSQNELRTATNYGMCVWVCGGGGFGNGKNDFGNTASDFGNSPNDFGNTANAFGNQPSDLGNIYAPDCPANDSAFWCATPSRSPDRASLIWARSCMQREPRGRRKNRNAASQN